VNDLPRVAARKRGGRESEPAKGACNRQAACQRDRLASVPYIYIYIYHCHQHHADNYYTELYYGYQLSTGKKSEKFQLNCEQQKIVSKRFALVSKSAGQRTKPIFEAVFGLRTKWRDPWDER